MPEPAWSLTAADTARAMCGISRPRRSRSCGRPRHRVFGGRHPADSGTLTTTTRTTRAAVAGPYGLSAVQLDPVAADSSMTAVTYALENATIAFDRAARGDVVGLTHDEDTINSQGGLCLV